MTTIDRPVTAVLLVLFIVLIAVTLYFVTSPWLAMGLIIVLGLIAAWELYLLIR